MAVLSALQHFDDPLIAWDVLNRYPKLPADARAAAAALLVSRRASARALVDAVAKGEIEPGLVPPEQVRRILLFHDPELDKAVAKHWGSLVPAGEREKADSIARVRKALAAGEGDAARGHAVFARTCAACHAFRGEGARIGPDLTGFGRRNLDYLVTNIVDPSAVIRPEYATYVLKTTGGETLTGAASDSGDSVTIDDGAARVTVPRDRVASLEPSPVSRMPEKLLDGMTDEQLRDLFAFLVSEGK